MKGKFSDEGCLFYYSNHFSVPDSNAELTFLCPDLETV